MKIINSNITDINEILKLYEIARTFQKTKKAVLWPQFDRKDIEIEIIENKQWKIIIDNQIACIWSIAFSDPYIWEERNSDPSLYIHRIATNPIFRGRNLVKEIIKWSKKYGKEQGKEFIRMDTVGENKRLINYYQNCGFEFLGLSKLKNTNNLPTHYHEATVSLFQMTT